MTKKQRWAQSINKKDYLEKGMVEISALDSDDVKQKKIEIKKFEAGLEDRKKFKITVGQALDISFKDLMKKENQELDKNKNKTIRPKLFALPTYAEILELVKEAY